MKTSRLLATVVGAAAVLSLAASCGDNSAVCGEGTVEVDGICVPEDLLDCGPGTVEMGGECVPDGSVICEQGTVFDDESGTCVVDPSACAEGTVLVGGQCVPEDETLTADHEEVAEPNDGILASDDVAGVFALPAVGASTTFHGCINPYRDLDGNGNPDPDLDLWIVTTTGPALVEITADGVGGLAAGFQVISATDVDVVDDNFVRFGINLTGDTSSRQMYLPASGVYGIFMADSRSLFLNDGAAGSPEACYYTTITNVALPTPTPVALNTEVAGTHDGDVDFYAADPADGSFFIGVHDMQAAAAFTSFWALKNNVVFEYGEPDGAGTPGVTRTGGLANADTVLYVIDPIYNYALSPVDYTLEVIAPPAGPIPTGGGSITIDNITTGEDFVGWFDVPANTMMNFEQTADAVMQLIFIDDHGFLVAQATTPFNNWIKFPSAGRYHVVINTNATTPAEVSFTSEIREAPITPITAGALVDNAPFNAGRAAWHSFDPGDEIWLSFNVPAATAWGTELRVDGFNLPFSGIPGTAAFPSLFNMTLNADGTETLGRIVYGDTTDYLIRITDPSATAGASSTYDLAIEDRTFTDLGTVTQAVPVAETGFDLAEAAERLFFVRASRGATHTVTVTPTGFDARVVFLGGTENVLTTVNAAGAGAAEVSARALTTLGWIAFRVENVDGTSTGVFDVGITSAAPYEVVTGNLVYQDICGAPGAVVLAQTPVGPFAALGDEAITGPQTPPTGFTLFGETVGNFYVSTNGFLAFSAPVNDAFFSNATIPSASGPNGVIAPYWDDFENIEICMSGAGTNLMTIQWEGTIFFSPTTVQIQARLRNTGVIEFIYGPAHLANGSGGTIGLENLTGTAPGTLLGFNTAGAVAPNSSMIATPSP